MPAWLVWLIAAGVLAAAETVSLAFLLCMFAGGAALAAIVAAIGAPLLPQFLVFLIGTGVLVYGVRPAVMRRLNKSPGLVTNSDRLIGRSAVVLSPVSAHEGGRVRLANGGEWTARAYDPHQAMAVGAVVRVVAIDGATAVVWQDATAPHTTGEGSPV